VLDLPGANRSVMGFNLIWMFDKVEELTVLMNELLALGVPPPLVGHTYTWDNLPEALREFRGGKTVGKVVVELPGAGEAKGA